MSATIAVVQTSAAGVGVAVEVIGTTAFQQVKLIDGGANNTRAIDATIGIPDPGSVGLVVAVKDWGLTVTVANQIGVLVANVTPIPVSGTVGISSITPVTTAASVSVSGLPVWLNPTQQVVVSGLAGHSVTGTVGISSITPVTTQASVSVSGLPVWLNPTQQVVVSGLAGHSVTGTVGISSITPVTTAASVSVSGLPVWLNPTQAVNVGSIVSTVLVNVVAGGAGGGSVTTAPPSISQSGQAMWIVGGQSTTAFPIWVSQINPPAGGGGSVTTSSPSISATGQIMWIVGGQSTTAFPVVVTGTVTAGAGTTVISIQNIVGVTTAVSVSVTGLPVWLNPTQQIFVSQVNPPAGGGGSVTTSSPSISATGQIMWIVGGQSTTAFPVVVTGTVTAGAGTTVVSVSAMVPVTTAASVSVTGWPVWLNPTQTIAVSGLAGHSITGSVNIVSTALVSIAGIVAVTTQASVSVSGLPVWLNPTQAVNVGSIASTVNVAIVAGAGGGGSVTTAPPSISQSGQAMWIVGGQSTTAFPIWVSQINPPAGGGGSVTTAPPSISQSGQAMWIVGGQSTTAFPVVVTGTVTAGAGTTVISIQNIVGVTTQASVSVTGIPVWWSPSATIQVSGQVIATTTQASGVTGALMWLAQSQVVIADILNISVSSTTGSPAVGSTGLIVVPKDFARQPVMIMVTSTAIAQSAAMYLMTIWTNGTVAAAATTAWPVPAGKVFRARVLQAAMTTSAVVGGTVQFVVLGATATASMVSGSLRTQGFHMLGQGIVTALPVQVGPMFADADVPAATTVGVAIIASTAAVLQNVVVQGYLF